MLFNPDRYVEDVLDVREIKVLKQPNNKVPAVNLPKLALDKRIAPITVSRSFLLTPAQLDLPLAPNVTLRDQFDWDLSDVRLRPCHFARALVETLLVEHDDPADKQKLIDKISNSILDQLNAYIEKNTFFPRVRFGKKEEERLTNEQICVNCDSVLANQDYCIHCGFLYERKVQGQVTASVHVQNSNVQSHQSEN